MSYLKQRNLLMVGKMTRGLIMFVAILAFAACDNIKEKTQQVMDKLSDTGDKIEYNTYNVALQKIVNELNKEFPQTFDYGVKVEDIDMNDRYVNVNIFVEENAIVTVSLIENKTKENRGELISKINNLLKSNDNKDFIKKLGIPGDFANMKSLLAHILRKTNREIAICARGSINADKIIVTTISPDELN
jgi:hypothetical protein